MDLPINWMTLAKQTWKEYGEDNVARLGAAFAYYTFTSFFPLLLVLIALVGLGVRFGLPSAQDAQAQVTQAVATNLPAAAPLLEQSFNETSESAGKFGVFGILLGIWTASNIFAQLEESFNVIFDVAPRNRSFIEKLKARGQAATIVLAIAALLIGSTVFSAVIAGTQGFVQRLPGGEAGAFVLNILISLALSALVFAALFKFLPDKPVSRKGALIGGVFTAIAWQIGRELITRFLLPGEDPAIGAVINAVLGFLVLIYWASQILMLGAEVTSTYDEMANPDLVRHKTSDDSALRGPGQPPVLESGKSLDGTQGSSAGESSGLSGVEARRARRVTARKNVTSFGVGFLTAFAAIYVALRKGLARLVDRVQGE